MKVSNSLIALGGRKPFWACLKYFSKMGNFFFLNTWSWNISNISRSVQFASDNIIHHTPSVSNTETSRFNATYGGRTNYNHTLVFGLLVQGSGHVFRDAFSNNGNGTKLINFDGFQGNIVGWPKRGKVDQNVNIAMFLRSLFQSFVNWNMIGVLK